MNVPRLDPERVLHAYRVGPVEYAVYVGDEGVERLRIREPEPVDGRRLRELMAGLARPGSPGEEYWVERLRSGFGPLYPLIIDPNVEEIAYSGASEYPSVIHKLVPARWIMVDSPISREEADSIAVQLARKSGRALSIASPYAEGLTSEGFRVAVTFSGEVSRFGSSFVVRKFPEKPHTMSDLVGSRVLSPLMAAYLWLLVEAQHFLMVIGGMGAGKTTILQALASLIPPYNRVITIEDTPELRIGSPNWDSLVTRPATPGEELGEVGLEDLLKFSLRRRAEYIVVGEVRGREARLLAQAAALGHGCLTTFHSDSPEAAIARLQLDPISLPPLFLHLLSSIVHVRRVPVYGGGVIRRVSGIVEVVGAETRPVFSWRPQSDSFEPGSAEEVARRSVKLDEAWARISMPYKSLEHELEERASFLEKLVGSSPGEFHAALAKYYIERHGLGGRAPWSSSTA